MHFSRILNVFINLNTVLFTPVKIGLNWNNYPGDHVKGEQRSQRFAVISIKLWRFLIVKVNET